MMEMIRCPECNSENLVKYGKIIVARKWVQKYLCKDCGLNTHKPKVEVK